MADSEPGDSPPPPSAPRASEGAAKRPNPAWAWLIAALAFLAFVTLVPSGDTGADDELSYSEFLVAVEEGEVATAAIDPEGLVEGDLADETSYSMQLPTVITGEELAARLEAADVEITGEGSPTSWLPVLYTFAPVLLLIGFFVWMYRRGGGGGLGGYGSVGKAKTRVIDEQRPDVRFDDVAGYGGVKQELAEIVDFLKTPGKFTRLGAVGPRGVLMVGPPGTGKTLLARALAGEAEVPVLTVTGSAFVELFVGVGAARVRDLFEQARKMAPAIIFIDEIDAVGQRRGANAMASNDEREQTVNQLLAEMDGFDPSEGVVVLAATNRPDVLDPALLRPGRFDRTIMIPLPNRDERQAILGVHCRKKPLAPDVDLSEVARATPGFSGADLANLTNEAAIGAVRSEADALTSDNFDEARDRVVLGRRSQSTILLPEERRAVAAHEAGHAIVAALSPRTDPLARVTILPSGPSLGATEQLPVDDRHLYSETYLQSLLTVRLGGRGGEIVAIGEASSGAADDLAKATELATRMVRELGLSPDLGPIGYPAQGGFLGQSFAGPHEFADDTQRAIDLEVSRLVREAEERAVAILQDHQPELEALLELLLTEETLSGERVYELLGHDVEMGSGDSPGY
ncbi:MAG: ATP-dependent zinc metalloprotease FtsH [Actinomycetia bacterium]|nr:ATP-dependent zinc metalloprotease FtsH [Actinomycetes bacterium]